MSWTEILTKCGVKKSTAEKWSPAFAELVKPESFSKGFSELDDFLAQIFHESGMLEKLEENLNYKTPENIRKAFGSKRFPTIESAIPFVRAPEKLANYAYGGRGGNNRDSDGWNYRGRGLIQLTFKDNYFQMSKYIGLDLVANPDLVAQPYFALKVSIGWWEGNIPDGILDDTKSVTKRVSGGDNGLAHREQLYRTVNGVIAEYI